jgi:hypothetical protein
LITDKTEADLLTKAYKEEREDYKIDYEEF